MKIIDKIKSLFVSEKSFHQDITQYLDSYGVGNKLSISQHQALSISAVYACIKVLSESIAQVPVNTYIHTDNGNKLYKDDGLYNLLKYEPNGFQDAYTFYQQMIVMLLIQGNFYAYKNVVNRKLVELLPLTNVTVTLDENYNKIYRASIGNTYKNFSQSEILHIMGMSLDGITGLNPIAYQRQLLGLAMENQKHGIAIYENGSRPSGILSAAGSLSPEARKRLVEQWQANMSGGKKGGIALLEEGFKYQQISLNNADLQFIETRKMAKEDICSLFRVPPHMIADLSKSSFSNITQQSLEFVKYSLQPWIIRIEQALRFQLLNDKQKNNGVYFKFNLGSLERADIETRFRVYKDAIMNGILSVNEIRELEERNAVPHGDSFLLPLNMVQLDDSGKPVSMTEFKSVDIKKKSAGNQKDITDKRNKARDKHYKPLMLALQSFVIKEVRELKVIIDNNTKSVDAGKLSNDIIDFYESRAFNDTFRKYIIKAFNNYINELSGIITDDTDLDFSDIDITDKVNDFIKDFIDIYAKEWSDKSKNQLLALIRDNQENIEDILIKRLDEWEDKKADKEANNEIVKADNIFTKGLWALAGVSYLVWRTQGNKTCAFCSQMDGKKVGINKPFLADGDVLTDGNTGMKIYGLKAQPPIHRACSCSIEHE